MLMAAFLAMVAAPEVAMAQGDRTQGVWLAADLQASAADEAWGRLSLRNGTLSFRSMNGLTGWEVTLADTRRIQSSKTGSKALEIESASGQVRTVAILDSRMLVDSPRKAMQAISLARLAVPVETQRLAVADVRADQPAPAGLAKIVRLDGGQIR